MQAAAEERIGVYILHRVSLGKIGHSEASNGNVGGIGGYYLLTKIDHKKAIPNLDDSAQSKVDG